MLSTSTGSHGDDNRDKGNRRVNAYTDNLFPESEHPAMGPHSRRGLSMATGTLSAFIYGFLKIVYGCDWHTTFFMTRSAADHTLRSHTPELRRCKGQ